MSRKMTTDEFVQRATKIHGDKYDYSLVEYRTTDVKIKLICNTCHDIIEQTPHNHLKGHDCLNCENLSRRSFIHSFILKANLLHNHKYDYSKSVYVNAETKILIGCVGCKSEFWQTPHSHLLLRGCAICANRKSSNTSKQEIEWLDSLGITQEYRQAIIVINGRKYNVDALNPTNNTIYEFYGDYWHGNKDKFASDIVNLRSKKTMGTLYAETMQREKLLKEAGYNIISIWESDWKSCLKKI